MNTEEEKSDELLEGATNEVHNISPTEHSIGYHPR